MAADQRGQMLARIAEMKGQRLTRAAADARTAAEAAAEAETRARSDRDAAAVARAEARASFTATPACPQARLWLDRQIAGEVGAVATLADQSARRELAQGAHGDAVRALDHHRLRTDIVAEHHRAERRAGVRRSEDRAEADMPVRVGGRAS
jgi:hypothetical protein